MKKYDVIIIGGGVVGNAIAYELSKRSPSSIALLEKNLAPALETSLNNSGVIHSGIHLGPSSLKAKLALRGRKKLIEFCKIFDLPHEQRGMIVLSSLPSQLSILDTLHNRARKQNIEARMVTTEEIQRREPSITALAGLLVEDVSIIDPQAFSLRLLEEAKKNGLTDVYLDSAVIAIEREDDGYMVSTTNETFKAVTVINAAGLYADAVAAMAGYIYPVEFYSGEYYHVIHKEKAAKIRGTLIYPAPLTGGPGLGTHITKKINGEVYLGPNAKRSVGPIFDDTQRSDPQEFIDDVRPFWPEIENGDLEWSFVGMRPKIADGTKDFLIKKERDGAFINIIGIESPGLTASLAIAEKVVSLVEQ